MLKCRRQDKPFAQSIRDDFKENSTWRDIESWWWNRPRHIPEADMFENSLTQVLIILIFPIQSSKDFDLLAKGEQREICESEYWSSADDGEYLIPYKINKRSILKWNIFFFTEETTQDDK